MLTWGYAKHARKQIKDSQRIAVRPIQAYRCMHEDTNRSYNESWIYAQYITTLLSSVSFICRECVEDS